MSQPLPQRKALRLEGYDYSAAGAYFVTFCTSEKQLLLGCVPRVGVIHESPVVCLSDCGEAVVRHILQLSERFPPLSVDAYVVMPNHVHLLLVLADAEERAIRESPLQGRSVGSEERAIRESPLRGRSVGFEERAIRESPLRGRSVLSKVVGYLKMNAGRDIRGLHIAEQVWQRGYHDHIVRDEADYLRISKYIHENPAKWSEDSYYIETRKE